MNLGPKHAGVSQVMKGGFNLYAFSKVSDVVLTLLTFYYPSAIHFDWSFMPSIPIVEVRRSDMGDGRSGG